MDTSKIIKGVVGGGRYTVTAPIVKEDYGLYLKIEGLELPSTYEVDFSNQEHNGTSVTMIGNADGVLIPSQFISSGKDIFAFLYHVGEDYGRTIFKFRIPNKLRPDRTDDQPTPEEQSVIDQAISALNSAVEQTAQDVETTSASAQSASQSAISADESAQSAQQSLTALTEYGDQAIQELIRITEEVNTSASNASDSAEASAQSAQSASQSAQTASEKADSITGLTATAQTLPSGSSATASYNAETGVLNLGIPKGKDGTDGTDGISPTVTITPITGGHRITITDKDGAKTADVMDGHNGMVTVNVSGTTPAITAQADTRYVCGEVATLDFTPSASGICDVVFTSGSTPTVVTLPSTVKFPDGAFIAEADTTYEINILDGIYGAVMAWT